MESSFAGWCNYKTKSQIWSPFLTQSIYQPFHLTPSHSIHQPFHLTPNQLTLTSKSPPLTINESHIDPSQSPSTPWLTSLPHPTPGSASLFFDTLAHLTSLSFNTLWKPHDVGLQSTGMCSTVREIMWNVDASIISNTIKWARPIKTQNEFWENSLFS